MIAIYILKDPIRKVVFYVGHAKDTDLRFDQHLSQDCHNRRLKGYIDELRDYHSVRPVFQIVEWVNAHKMSPEVFQREGHWQHEMLKYYWLCNVVIHKLKGADILTARERGALRRLHRKRTKKEQVEFYERIPSLQPGKNKAPKKESEKRPGGRLPASDVIPDRIEDCKRAADRYAWIDREEERAKARTAIASYTGEFKPQ